MKVQRYKHDLDISYALGATLTYELLKFRYDIVNKVYLNSSIKETESISDIRRMCQQYDIPVLVNDKAFNILSPKGNCFVIAEFKKEIQDLEKTNHIVLVNPSDAGNLGTILRTCAGFGITNIAIIRPAVDIYDPKVVRASMGALFHVRIKYYDSMDSYMDEFKENIRYAFMLRNSRPLTEIEINEPYSLIFGNEATGLPDSFSTFCNAVLIKHSKNIDSLNLPMAAGIAMYEFTKKDWK